MTVIVNHEDIWIESGESLSWVQFFDDTLPYEHLNINAYEYTDYRPTRLQFTFTSATSHQSLAVKIKYKNRLTQTHVKHAIVCRYDSALNQWIKYPHSLNEEDHLIEFSSSVTGTYGVFVNHYWYSDFTQRMADEYPNWTKIRNDKTSTGQQFLNYFGIELETVRDYLKWIQEQKYISTADVHMYDWIKMYPLPSISMSDTITVWNEGKKVEVLETLREFFYNERNNGGILDYQDMRFYIEKSQGPLRFDIVRNGTITSLTVEAMDFHIWNTFDEFGMLLGVKRLHLESNEDFKERILDVFRYPSGTHDLGLTHGIARDLSLIERKDENGKRLIWTDDTKDFLLLNKSGRRVDIRTLMVDDTLLNQQEYSISETNDIRIYAKNTGRPHEISFVYGIEKHQLYDKRNTSMYRMMFQEDGQATPKLSNWVEYVNTVAPVMWGRFNWDEGFWDTIDKKLTGLGYIPNIWDSSIDSWKTYEFKSEI
jgi:hypothetical protein